VTSDRFPRRDPKKVDPKNPGHTERYGIVVICRDEAHQQSVYDELRARGHQLKVVVT
jgi:hypothetical protein